MRQTGWLAVAAGMAVGVAIGILYAWLISPVEYVDTAPSSLRPTYRQQYMALIAQAYASTGDLERAKARLNLFQLDDAADELAALAQQQLADQGEDEARALAALAADLGQRPTPLVMRSPTAGTTPTVSPTRRPTLTPTPTRRPTATPTFSATQGAPYELTERQVVCQAPDLPPLLQVEVYDAAGRPVPGVEVQVLSDDGQDHFFTGLKPELGLGYGDFEMDPVLSYTVQLDQAARPVADVGSEPCQTDDGTSYPGSILLMFEQPGQ
jgi:hypothetical protein